MHAKVDELQKLATEMVGDDQSPDVFFVTSQGIVTLITTDFPLAYREWRTLANDRGKESALENRQFGVIASREPDGEDAPNRRAKLVLIDDSELYQRFHADRHAPAKGAAPP